MGKIHDALEKASKQNQLKPPHNKHQEPEQTATGSNGKKIPTSIDTVAEKKVIPLKSLGAKSTGSTIDPMLVTLAAPLSREAELFKQLRTNLLFPISGKAPKSILVTSALPGEGKSLLSANLAISVAKGIQEHVLLIDCDMRKPSIHKLFGLPEERGLSDFLSKGVPLPSLLKKTPVDKLTLLLGGPSPPNPTELLSSRQMSDLLIEVKQRYDDRYIIIDTPPWTLTAETNALVRQVDGIILVIKSGKTSKKLIDSLIETIGKEKILGVVLNWYESLSAHYLNYSKYGEYYKTGKP